ncbi:hypothetical protein DL764_010961 [Monosporascus ibericus]|uniref:Uncharacterized protein n=1 Tax=Monosporascus ibericus TaxID=155417 RepID=A0A4Q4SU54_9PEZI|nr:hypothetical protein DL764_010961 [Monosporascus ibericus]
MAEKVSANPDSHQLLVKEATSMYSKKMAVYLHLYGTESKPSRKISRITIAGFVSIAELEMFAQPLILRLRTRSGERDSKHPAKSSGPEQEVNPPAKTKGSA